MSEHSRIAPSSAARVIQCPGSLVAEETHPPFEEDPSAAEGTAAHWVLQSMIAGTTPLLSVPAPNGVMVVQEMIDCADVAIETMLTELMGHGLTLADLAVEAQLSIPRVHPLCFGTPDARAWAPGARPTLLLFDYKYGHGSVEVYENPQLAAYACGAISATKISDLGIDVHMCIIQPRSFHRDGVARWWRTTAGDLRGIINLDHAAAEVALLPNPRFTTGPECKNCTARHACPTLQRVASHCIDESGKMSPACMDAAAVGVELTVLTAAAARLEARKTGLEAQATMLLRSGAGTVPGWALESGLGRRVWAKPDADVIAMGKLLGVDLAKPPAAVTPKQSLDLGFNEGLVASLSAQKRSAVALVPDDGSAARKAFLS